AGQNPPRGKTRGGFCPARALVAETGNRAYNRVSGLGAVVHTRKSGVKPLRSARQSVLHLAPRRSYPQFLWTTQ
ncbi:hypothetical protein, partial [Escherichia coli]|uniref:hypothetical protein n=1 Tax=Escherichia coli TaxID=562 RepID=UPI0019D5A3EF